MIKVSNVINSVVNIVALCHYKLIIFWVEKRKKFFLGDEIGEKFTHWLFLSCLTHSLIFLYILYLFFENFRWKFLFRIKQQKKIVDLFYIFMFTKLLLKTLWNKTIRPAFSLSSSYWFSSAIFLYFFYSFTLSQKCAFLLLITHEIYTIILYMYTHFQFL